MFIINCKGNNVETDSHIYIYYFWLAAVKNGSQHFLKNFLLVN